MNCFYCGQEIKKKQPYWYLKVCYDAAKPSTQDFHFCSESCLAYYKNNTKITFYDFKYIKLEKRIDINKRGKKR